MGFMTEVSILNDMWHDIRSNPKEFVEQVYQKSVGGSESRYGRYIIGQATVAQTHHADDLRVYFSARNSFFDAYPSKNMNLDGLNYHLKSIREMKRYLKICEDATKDAIVKHEISS